MSSLNLPLRIDELAIADGQLPQPGTGEVLTTQLTFRGEAGSGDRPLDDEVILSAHAEPEAHLFGTQVKGHPTLLHGDGWTARWAAAAVASGPVSIRGRLWIDYDPFSAPLFPRTTGLVTRVLVEEKATTWSTDGQRWIFVDGPGEWRDVTTCPSGFGPVAPLLLAREGIAVDRVIVRLAVSTDRRF